MLGSLVLGAVFGKVLRGAGPGTILSMIGGGRVIYLFNRAARVPPCAARPGWRTEPANAGFGKITETRKRRQQPGRSACNAVEFHIVRPKA